MAYRHYHLYAAIDCHDEIALIEGMRPIHTPMHDILREVTFQSKKESSSVIAKIIHRLRCGADADRTEFVYERRVSREQAASTEATVSRILEMEMRGQAEWAFHVTDPLGSGIALSPDQLPSLGFEFIGKTDIPAPPPTNVDIEVLSFWCLQNWDGTYGKPAYSNMFQIVNLEVPSNLRGNHDATLELWPKRHHQK
jgi:hypothetical protein